MGAVKFLTGALLLIFGASAMASGDAGCGLGSVIISKNSKGLQLLAMTTNQSLLTQPLGITFNTSGCSASGLVMNEKEVEYFVETNQKDLEREIAQGHGEKLVTLSKLSGCSSSAAVDEFSSSTQRHFPSIVNKENLSSAELVKNLKAVVTADEKLVRICTGATSS